MKLLFSGIARLAFFSVEELCMALFSADLTFSVPVCPDMEDAGRMRRAYSAPGSNHRS